jgi:hypothetical protein
MAEEDAEPTPEAMGETELEERRDPKKLRRRSAGAAERCLAPAETAEDEELATSPPVATSEGSRRAAET